jgi:hypothetical protein
MAESALWKHVLLAAHKFCGVRLFRSNNGQGWVGRSRKLRPGETYTACGGEVLIQDARPLHAGLVKGSGDGIGWRTITITPDMVGQRAAIFLSVETKVPRTGYLEPDQRNWRDQVLAAGGIAVVARGVEDLNEPLGGGFPRPPP